MKAKQDCLGIFHPIVAQWFAGKHGAPTGVQREAWPLIAEGKHVLASAPTGSGKTLAAFLWALNRIIAGQVSRGGVRVLYVSPLKALNNDIRHNLLIPLAEMRQLALREGVSVPDIRVLTRSGDTPSSERQRMRRHPPEILITTPESLNLILSTHTGAAMFEGLGTVVLDEIHAVISNKRGAHLMSAVERLVLTAGEFQRIALSATVRPLEGVAEFVGGYEIDGSGPEYAYVKRPVCIVRSDDAKVFQIRVTVPRRSGGVPADEGPAGAAMGKETTGNRNPPGHGPRAPEPDGSSPYWDPFVDEFGEIVEKNRSTLIFTGTRRHAEKFAYLLNRRARRDLAYAHHGSLSREIRAEVERRLREGRLKAIVATSSLELGIDVGSLDEVVLVQTPASVSSALQRIGRAGHRVGAASRGVFLPVHPRDLLDAAVMARCVMERDIEETSIVRCPLDVLAQVIVSMCAVEEWKIDELYARLRGSESFHALARRQFDLVLAMLGGRYEETRIRELRPRVVVDRVGGTVRAVEGSRMLLYHSGGTIPDRGSYTLRLQGAKEKIGELDEEFVWERRVGDTFSLGTQSWRITGIDHQSVEVVPWRGPVGIIPFWKAEREARGFHFSARVGEFLERWHDRLENGGLERELRSVCHADEAAAARISELLLRQKTSCGGELPHRHRLVIEHLDDASITAGTGRRTVQDVKQVIVHTLWGGRVNAPYAYALAAAWEEEYGYPLEVFADDDAILLMLPHDIHPTGLIRMVHAGNLEKLLRRKLETTGYFGARFRENSGRALLLPRGGFMKRMPLWLNRLRSKKLFEAVTRFGDFPMLLETWRECLRDEFDLDSLKMLLDEVGSGEIGIGEARTATPSPFARGLVWRGVNAYMYEGDEPAAGRTAGTSEELFREVALSSSLRPTLQRDEVSLFQAKLQRTAPGYSPGNPPELLGWVIERLLIPEPEWLELLVAIERDHGVSGAPLLAPLEGKLVRVKFPGSALPSVAAVQTLPRIMAALGLSPTGMETGPAGDPSVILEKAGEGTALGAEVMGEWLSYYGPLAVSSIDRVFGRGGARQALESLSEGEEIVLDRLTAGAEELEVCDARNLERLLRLKRLRLRPLFTPLEPAALQLFIARWQGLTGGGEGPDALKRVLEKLFGYPAPVELWERDILPARLGRYSASWLDALLQGGNELMWFGCGKEKAGFCFRQELALFRGGDQREASGVEKEGKAAGDGGRDGPASLLPHPEGRYSFREILAGGGLGAEDLGRALWDGAWRTEIFNDSWESVRRGIRTGFRLPVVGERDQPWRGSFGVEGRLARWKSSGPMIGSWYLMRTDPAADPVDEEERIKDRIRQLFERWGVLFRELLETELPPLRWSKIFRTLRIMELSGEALGGRFFGGVDGLQFASPRAYRLLQGTAEKDSSDGGAARTPGTADDANVPVYWMNACDPASLCGVRIKGLPARLPARLPSTHVVHRGDELVLVSKKKGRELKFYVEPDCPVIPLCLAFFRTFLKRDFQPAGRVRVEVINGVEAEKSPYAGALIAFGFQRSYRGLSLERRV
jgi:ATP-dependent Lhr-like helicase